MKQFFLRVVLFLGGLVIIGCCLFFMLGTANAQEPTRPVLTISSHEDVCVLQSEGEEIISLRILQTSETLYPEGSGQVNVKIPADRYTLRVILENSFQGLVWIDASCTADRIIIEDTCALLNWEIEPDSDHPLDIVYYADGEYIARYIADSAPRKVFQRPDGDSLYYVYVQPWGEAGEMLITAVLGVERGAAQIIVEPDKLEQLDNFLLSGYPAAFNQEPYEVDSLMSGLFSGQYDNGASVFWFLFPSENIIRVVLFDENSHPVEGFVLPYVEQSLIPIPCGHVPRG